MGMQVAAQVRCPECNYLHDLTIDLGIVPLPTVTTCLNEECAKFFAMRPIFPTVVQVESWRMIPPRALDGEADAHEQPVDDSTGAYAFDPEAQARAEREAGAAARAASDAWRGRFG